jgi:CRISPR-associated endonuclease/helicase Cas3
MDFNSFFPLLVGDPTRPAREWQRELALEPICCDRLVRAPTGFGKTLGVLGAWVWNCQIGQRADWPRRLVWCLPMRVLVEQTEAEVRAALQRFGMLWDGDGSHEGKVGVHVLIGGGDAGDWHLFPEHAAVLIGTQDMLLSRALNRGYGAPRARWPMEFGLLNHDCLWVMDEVQLMDVGLATSGQLQAFRRQDTHAGKALRPCHTWWMSATLQRAWLAASPETASWAEALPQVRIPPTQRQGPLWDDVQKPLRLQTLEAPAALAKYVAERHIEAGRGRHGPTLVVLNTVRDAVEVHVALAKDKALHGTDLRLVHSRFRAHERASWHSDFLNRDACTPGTDRIIVATQVIEAGVDISAGLLVSALAPWTSLVQRFGRAARWGGSADVIVVDLLPGAAELAQGKELDERTVARRERAALPYILADLEAARDALHQLDAVAPLQLEAFEDAHPELLSRLYPYAPRHLLLRHELDEMFDTVPDLSGADIDISRFIRSGDERDLLVFWAEVPRDQRQPDDGIRASRDAVCAVPFLAARDWLCGKESGTSKAPRLKAGKRAWVWDYLEGGWRTSERKDLYPGQTVLVAADSGGYDPETGWNPESRVPVTVVVAAEASVGERADAVEQNEALSAIPRWQTIATHGAQVGALAAAMANTVGLERASLLHLAGRWHDAGKALPPFQASIRDASDGDRRPQRHDLAKAPRAAWPPACRLYPDPPRGYRRGYRHELASTLALFAVLIRHQPDHAALLGPWRELLAVAGLAVPVHAAPGAAPTPLEQEILALGAEDFDLVTYLVCSHHGKVRVAWHASPADQAAADSVLRLRGVRDGEVLPSLQLVDAEGRYATVPESILNLDAAAAGLNPRTGRGWTERVLGLLARHGPFTLAYLEAILRAADQRASRAPLPDPLLEHGS